MGITSIRRLGFRCTVFVVATAAISFACSSEGDRELVRKSESSIILGPDGGWVMEDAGFCCYDYLTNSCHQAANCGVDAGNDGVLSCTGSTGGPYGHTVVWDRPDPKNPRQVCIAEPQLSGSTACCWTDNGSTGTPDLSSPGAQACIEKLCKKQFTPDAAVALDASWDVNYLDCAGTTNDRASCDACCDRNADAIPATWGDAAIDDRENYRTQCKQQCASK